jgi:hypothetical protein
MLLLNLIEKLLYIALCISTDVGHQWHGTHTMFNENPPVNSKLEILNLYTVKVGQNVSKHRSIVMINGRFMQFVKILLIEAVTYHKFKVMAKELHKLKSIVVKPGNKMWQIKIGR